MYSRQIVHVCYMYNHISWKITWITYSCCLCTLRLSLYRLAASFYNIYTAATAAVAKLDPQNEAAPAVTWFCHVCGKPLLLHPATRARDTGVRLTLGFALAALSSPRALVQVCNCYAHNGLKQSVGHECMHNDNFIRL